MRSTEAKTDARHIRHQTEFSIAAYYMPLYAATIMSIMIRLTRETPAEDSYAIADD